MRGAITRRIEETVVAGAPAVVVDVVLVLVAHHGVQHVGTAAALQGVVAHQAGPRGHAAHADAVAVAGTDHAGHIRAVALPGVAGHGPGATALPAAVADVVVAGTLHHIGGEVVVGHFQAVVHHCHADAFTPGAQRVPDLGHVQILGGPHAAVAGEAAGVLQVPLGGKERVIAAALGSSRLGVVFERAAAAIEQGTLAGRVAVGTTVITVATTAAAGGQQGGQQKGNGSAGQQRKGGSVHGGSRKRRTCHCRGLGLRLCDAM